MNSHLTFLQHLEVEFSALYYNMDMTGQNDFDRKEKPVPNRDPKAARRHWEESMLRQLEELQAAVRTRSPQILAAVSGGTLEEGLLELPYWGSPIRCNLSSGEILGDDNQPLSTFDLSMVLFYLSTNDGQSPADRWVSFREFPDGVFYNQAFQGYSGRLLAERFGNNPEAMNTAAAKLGGTRLPALSPAAWRFLPFPKLPIAAVLWPGDEELPGQAQILFDAAADGKMVIDGLALLGGQLSRRLIKASAS
jgi:hypothetical protein